MVCSISEISPTVTLCDFSILSRRVSQSRSSATERSKSRISELWLTSVVCLVSMTTVCCICETFTKTKIADSEELEDRKKKVHYIFITKVIVHQYEIIKDQKLSFQNKQKKFSNNHMMIFCRYK